MQNFVGWYRQAAHENMGAISGLFKALGDVLPGFDSISLMTSGENTRALKVAFRRASDDGRLDVYGFGQLSDGQRALLALYCLVFLSSNRRASLFLDEPDNYLALREIQPWLAAVGEHCGNTLEQAVVVSHHPRNHRLHGRGEGPLVLPGRQRAGSVSAISPTRRLRICLCRTR